MDMYSRIEKMSRNVFESILFASYFAPHRRKVEGPSSTSVQEMDSSQKFSNVTVTKILCTPATVGYYLCNAIKIRIYCDEFFSKFFYF